MVSDIMFSKRREKQMTTFVTKRNKQLKRHVNRPNRFGAKTVRGRKIKHHVKKAKIDFGKGFNHALKSIGL